MDDNNLEVSINSVGENEYKTMYFESLSDEDVVDLDKDKQVLIMCKVTNGILLIAPKVWFSTTMDFMDRVKTDLYKFVKYGLERVKRNEILNVVRLIDFMGTETFINYLSFDAVESLTDSAFGNEESGLEGTIEEATYNKFMQVATASALIKNDEMLHEYIDLSDITEGCLCMGQQMFLDIGIESIESISSDVSLQSAYCVRVVLTKEYMNEREYCNDVDRVYIEYLNLMMEEDSVD